MNGWTKTVSRFHYDLSLAMAPYQGKQLSTREVAEIVRATPALADNAQFIYASDHCNNHTNKGACICALHGDGEPIFERLKRGLFLVRNTNT